MSTISVVVPCYNEEETLRAFYAETERVRTEDFAGVADFEYIFVDDGSSDGTLSLLKELAAEDTAVSYVSFSRNFGKEAAILAGLERARGDYVTLMDADLQDPPNMLKDMYDAIVGEGYDQVATRRTTRKGEPPLRSFCARAFYKIINAMSDVEMVASARDYRLMTRAVVDAILSLPEKTRYSKGIFSYVGFRTKWLPYENTERVAGTTKWSFRRLCRYAADGIVAFASRPLVLPAFLGVFFLFLSIVGLVFSLVFANMILAVFTAGLFVAAVVLLCAGVIGKYFSQAFAEIKARPPYIVRETNREPDKK